MCDCPNGMHYLFLNIWEGFTTHTHTFKIQSSQTGGVGVEMRVMAFYFCTRGRERFGSTVYWDFCGCHDVVVVVLFYFIIKVLSVESAAALRVARTPHSQWLYSSAVWWSVALACASFVRRSSNERVLRCGGSGVCGLLQGFMVLCANVRFRHICVCLYVVSCVSCRVYVPCVYDDGCGVSTFFIVGCDVFLLLCLKKELWEKSHH